MDLKEELMSDTIDDVIGEADEDEERLVYGHPTGDFAYLHGSL